MGLVFFNPRWLCFFMVVVHVNTAVPSRGGFNMFPWADSRSGLSMWLSVGYTRMGASKKWEQIHNHNPDCMTHTMHVRCVHNPHLVHIYDSIVIVKYTSPFGPSEVMILTFSVTAKMPIFDKTIHGSTNSFKPIRLNKSWFCCILVAEGSL